MVDWIQRHRPTSLLGCLALLTLAVALMFPPVASIARASYGQLGLVSAGIAALVCWFAATLALVATAIFRGPQMALYSMLFGMLFRMGLPLGAGLVLSQSAPRLAAAGVFGLIVVFYLVTLVVERLLSLCLVSAAHSTQGAG